MDFIDLKTQQRLLADSIQARLLKVLVHGQYVLGPEVDELESRLAAFTGAGHCVACASGSSALLLALMGKGVGPGDAVFTTPFTFIATAEAIAWAGTTPVFVDIDPRTYNLDPECLEAAIQALEAGKKPSPGSPEGLKPRAVLAVDLFGLPADYARLGPLAARHGLILLEDAAQSLGASRHGRKAGSFGDAAAASFFPSKPLGGYGDGGAVFTGDPGLTEILRSLRVHGRGPDKDGHMRLGLNARLDTLQAAILLSKLEVFPRELEMRRRVASRYSEGLRGMVETPQVPDGVEPAWAQYSVCSSRREELMGALESKGIPAVIYYPKPLHLQPVFAPLRYADGDFPVAEKTAAEIFSLPMGPYLREADQDRIIACLKAAS